ncbi:MAG: hypothetical protein SGPRY_007152 [Prymnesium sp.]
MSPPLDRFDAWCVEAGISRDERASFTCDERTGAGLSASACIAPGTAVLRIPKEASFSISQLSRAAHGIEPALAPLFASLDHTNALALAVCLQTDKSDPSQGRYGPWAALWPADAVGGWAIAEEDWQELCWWPELREVHAQQEAAARAAYEHSVQYFATNSLGQPPSWERFCWACSVISSRAVAVEMCSETQPALVPLLDLLNHQTSQKVNCTICYEQAEEGDLFVVLTKRQVEPGEELTICYGKKDNAALAAGYGFAMEENEFDTVMLRVPLGLENDPITAQRVGMLPSGMATLDVETDNSSEKSVRVVLYWDTKECESALSADLWSPSISTEMLLVLALANSNGISELFLAMGRASNGNGTDAEWGLLQKCCEVALTSLPQGNIAADHPSRPWNTIAQAGLQSRRAMLARTIAFVKGQNSNE